MILKPIPLLKQFKALHEYTTNQLEGTGNEVYEMLMTCLLFDRVPNFQLSYSVTQTPEPGIKDPNVYQLNIVCGSKSDAMIKTLPEKAKAYKANEKVLSNMTKKTVYVRVIEDENTAYVFLPDPFLGEIYYVLSIVSTFFPSIDKAKRLTEEEIELLKTLTGQSRANFETGISALLKNKCLEKYLLSIQLSNFERKMLNKRIKVAETQLSTMESKMEELLKEYSEICVQRMTQVAIINGLTSMQEKQQADTELQEYFQRNRNICNLCIDGDVINFNVKTMLAPYNFDSWEDMSKRGAIFEKCLGGSCIKTPADAKLILNAILCEDWKLRVKMCANFQLNYLNGTIESRKYYNFINDDLDFAHYIPNPHLYHYNCFGLNKATILKALKDGDTIGAIEGAINVARRINVSDPSFNRFIDDLYAWEGKCFVTRDGTEMKLKEALQYLKENNND